MYRVPAPFGDIVLGLEAPSAVLLAGDPTSVRPVLPDGMRIEECWLRSFVVECEFGDEFSAQLGFDAGDGWVAEYASGEGLDAFELRHSHVGVVAFGMRDPEWLCQRFTLVYLEASSGRIGNNLLTARYKALRRTSVQIQVACSWTNLPKIDSEWDSPSFAVDLAMTF